MKGVHCHTMVPLQDLGFLVKSETNYIITILALMNKSNIKDNLFICNLTGYIRIDNSSIAS